MQIKHETTPYFINFRHYLNILIPILLGLTIFLFIFGIRPLDVANIGWWGTHEDPIQAWLGWSFFRQSPWQWPWALNPYYGIGGDNSLIYTDSIPFLAMALKPFSSYLPPIFQYHGWWLLICFILQIWFAWKTLNLFIPSIILKTIITPVFIFTPVFLFRLDCHLTLAGQFLILAAYYLYLSDSSTKNYLFWGLL